MEEKKNICDEEMVYVTVMGTIAEIKKSNAVTNSDGIIKKIDKYHYVDLSTGEVKEFQKLNRTGNSQQKQSRKDSPKSLAYTAKTQKDIIITNFIDTKHTVYLTLLYDDIMTDFERASKDIKNFIKKLRRNFPDNPMKYVILTELHHTGSIHFHLLLYCENPYTRKFVRHLKSSWKKGEAFCRKIKNNEDILYLAAYFVYGFTAKSDGFDKYDLAIAKAEKRAIKSARLEEYPIYSRVIKHSKNMKKGKKYEMTYSEAKEKYGCNSCFHSGEYEKKMSEIYIRQFYEYYRL